MMPYLVTVIVVVVAIKRNRMPAALAQAYKPHALRLRSLRPRSEAGAKA
jgi:hypothetical protein